MLSTRNRLILCLVAGMALACERADSSCERQAKELGAWLEALARQGDASVAPVDAKLIRLERPPRAIEMGVRVRLVLGHLEVQGELVDEGAVEEIRRWRRMGSGEVQLVVPDDESWRNVVLAIEAIQKADAPSITLLFRAASELTPPSPTAIHGAIAAWRAKPSSQLDLDDELWGDCKQVLDVVNAARSTGKLDIVHELARSLPGALKRCGCDGTNTAAVKEYYWFFFSRDVQEPVVPIRVQLAGPMAQAVTVVAADSDATWQDVYTRVLAAADAEEPVRFVVK